VRGYRDALVAAGIRYDPALVRVAAGHATSVRSAVVVRRAALTDGGLRGSEHPFRVVGATEPTGS